LHFVSAQLGRKKGWAGLLAAVWLDRWLVNKDATKRSPLCCTCQPGNNKRTSARPRDKVYMADLTTLPHQLDEKMWACRVIIETPEGCRNKFDYDLT
jgi:hypothetical protein